MVNMDLRTAILVVLVGILILNSNEIATDETYFDNVQIIGSTYFDGVMNFSAFRIGKFNRTMYVLNADVNVSV